MNKIKQMLPKRRVKSAAVIARQRGTLGQATLEILVAVGILALVLSAMLSVIWGGQSLSTDSQEASKALNLARQTIEQETAIAKSDFNSVISSSSNQDEFLKEIIVENVDTNTKKVTSKVSWQNSPTRVQKIELTTLLTNWQLAGGSGGDTGGTPPSGDWTHPVTLGSVDLGPGEQATDLDVVNKIVYMTAVASDSNKPDFFIVDATNGQNPVIVSSLDTGRGLNSIDVAGQYAYVAGKDDAEELQIIDISDKNNPIKVASLNLPGNQDALTIFYWDKFVYIGRKDDAPQEFNIVDVSSPLSPQLVSGLSNVGNEINDIYVYNNKAYLGTEVNSRGMIIIDVSDKAHPQVLGSLNAGQHVYGIYVQSEGLVSTGAKNDFRTVDAADPANVTTLGTVSIGRKTRDVVSTGPYAFLATEDSNREFIAMNILNPQSPAIISSLNFPNIASGIDYENNLVYVSVRSNDALRIITSSP